MSGVIRDGSDDADDSMIPGTSTVLVPVNTLHERARLHSSA